MYEFLPRVAVEHDKVVANMEEFSAYFEDGIATVVADDEGFGQAPGSFSDMVAHRTVSSSNGSYGFDGKNCSAINVRRSPMCNTVMSGVKLGGIWLEYLPCFTSTVASLFPMIFWLSARI